MPGIVEEGEKHFTSSVCILSKGSPKKMLLIHHRKYGKWIQPGGHIDRFENPVETAIREVKEETGIDISFLKDKISIVDKDGTFLPLPAYLMEFTIPELGDQPKHYHIDTMYVVEIDEQRSLQNNDQESHGTKWFTKKEILRLDIHEDTRIIVQKLM